MTSEQFIIPQNLTIPSNDKKNLLDFYNNFLINEILKKSKITVFQIPFSIDETIKQTNNFLEKYQCKISHFGLFVTPKNLYDKTIHIDGCQTPTRKLEMLEARFSYYDLMAQNGEIEWFKDIGDKYEKIIIKKGKSARSYQFKWVDDYEKGLINLNQCPPSLFKFKTNVPSAIVRTNIPHRVITENEIRATLGFQIVDYKSQEPNNIWERFI